MLDPSVFSRYKSVEDFTRERDEFEARKRAAALQEQLSGLQVQGLQKQLSTPEALSNEQILAKAVQAGGIGGLSPQEQAQLQAFDIMQRTKQSQNPYTGNIITNRSIYDMLPGQVAQMPPRDVMNMPTRAPMPTQAPPQQPFPYPMPPGGEQIPAGGNLGVSTQQPPMVATPTAMPTAPINTQTGQVQLPPLATQTPFGIEAAKRAQDLANIELQKTQIEEGIKAQAKQAEMVPEKQNFDRELAGVLDAVSELRDMGAGVRTEQSAGQNIGASLRSTSIGQGLGQMVGTREQKLRDFIDSKRPVLFNQIKKASGLTGAELNSKFEVENQLKQLGNESINIDTRYQILMDLSRQFGLGEAGQYTKYKPYGGQESVGNIDNLLNKYAPVR